MLDENNRQESTKKDTTRLESMVQDLENTKLAESDCENEDAQENSEVIFATADSAQCSTDDQPYSDDHSNNGDQPCSDSHLNSQCPSETCPQANLPSPSEASSQATSQAGSTVPSEEQPLASVTKPSWLCDKNESSKDSENSVHEAQISRVSSIPLAEQKSSGFRWGSFLVLSLMVVSVCLGFSLALRGPSYTTIVEESDEESPLEGLFTRFGTGKDGVAIVNISGVIQSSTDVSLFSQQKGAERVIEQLKKLGENKNVKAVVLRINSPGGTVGSCQEISSEIKRLREKGIKVVASLADVAASGGVYIAVQAEKIIANPGTITGSVGVIFSVFTLPELLEKLGVKMEAVTSGRYKDIGSYARNMRDDERELLQEVVDLTQEQFLNAVAEGRQKGVEEVRRWADGRIFNGEQAMTYGLVDEIGTLQDAVDLAWKMAGMEGKPYLIKDKPDPFEQFSEMFSMSLRSLWPFKVQHDLNTHAPLLFYYPGGGKL